ncbi:MAG TPA: GIY-YIG nuclease family protein [Fimbriimonadaceae bacterium]|jgi:putative endonuclease
MRRERIFFVYIMASNSRVLYTGVTNALVRRVSQHKAGVGSEFTSRYKTGKLVYFETFSYVRNAIAREKRIKAGSRADKIRLIETLNRDWRDISDDFKLLPADIVRDYYGEC